MNESSYRTGTRDKGVVTRVDEKKMTPAKAMSLCSIAVDFHVAEAVDGRQVVAGKIPKAIFLGAD